MYDFGRRVYVKSVDRVGAITERGYHTGGNRPRRAFYVVEFAPGADYMTGSRDLRAADYLCDGCSAWREGTPHVYGRDGEYEHGLAFCFLCAGPPAEREARRLEWEYLSSLPIDQI